MGNVGPKVTSGLNASHTIRISGVSPSYPGTSPFTIHIASGGSGPEGFGHGPAAPARAGMAVRPATAITVPSTAPASHQAGGWLALPPWLATVNSTVLKIAASYALGQHSWAQARVRSSTTETVKPDAAQAAAPARDLTPSCR